MALPVKSDDEIYVVLEKALEGISEPQTCAALMERPDVRAAALKRFDTDVQISTNKLSDLLGFMWRRGILDRFPAPPGRSQARFAYALKDRFTDFNTPIPYIPAKQSRNLGNHALSIEEKDGEVVLDFQQFTIVIRPKK